MSPCPIPSALAAPTARSSCAVPTDIDAGQIAQAFVIGNQRTFDEDPRFGLIALSEIASRALSPGINDPGTAIDVIGTMVRLFTRWSEPVEEHDLQPGECDRVAVPEISLRDMFEDAFRPIARDGAGTIEVAVRLQKAFESLATIEDATMRDVAIQHARWALDRAENTLEFPNDLEVARKCAEFAMTETSAQG